MVQAGNEQRGWSDTHHDKFIQDTKAEDKPRTRVNKVPMKAHRKSKSLDGINPAGLGKPSCTIEEKKKVGNPRGEVTGKTKRG